MEVFHRGIAACLLTVLTTLVILSGCSGGDGDSVAAPAIPVQVAEVERRDVPLSIDMVGSTLGSQDVPIRARVEGFLESVDFQEGRFVDEGQLLYTIDGQPFQAKVVEAEAGLAAATTMLAKAESDLSRIRPLAEMNAVSQQDLDAAIAMEAAARAGVRASRAGVELAEIEMSYTRIHAPIAGLIGLTKAKPGEFVGREPNPVVLNVLSDIDPIHVRFSIAEREYLILSRTYLKEGRADARRGLDEAPRASDLILILADGSEHNHKGRPIAAAQSIDSETGTYTVEAAFPNPDGLLLPGQFARVRAPYRTLENVTVMPRKALIELQGRFHVYAVADDETVQVIEVEPGPVVGNEIVIESGLNGGESIIVEGTQKVRPGMQVKPVPAPPEGVSGPLQEA